MDGMEDNFKKREEASSAGFNLQYDNETSLDPKNTPYDMDSVLHYGPLDFSKNGLPVIEFLHDDKGRWPVAPPEDPLTTIDRVEIALTYSDEGGCVVKNADMVKYVHINRMVNRLWIDNNSKMINIIKKKSEAKLADMDTILNSMNAEIAKVKINQTDIDRTQNIMRAREVDLQRVIKSQQLEIKANQLAIGGLQRVNEAQQIESKAKQVNIDDLQRVIQAHQIDIKRNVDLLKQLVESQNPCQNPNILDSKTRHVSTRARSSLTAQCGSRGYCCDIEADNTRMHPDWQGEGW